MVTQLARRRSVDEVKALMQAPESLADALARVRRQVSRGSSHASAGRSHASAGRRFRACG